MRRAGDRVNGGHDAVVFAPLIDFPFANRTILSYKTRMDRDRFIRRLRRLARKSGMTLSVDASHGKGSHVIVSLADRRTTVPQKLPVGTLRAICRQLGVNPNDLSGVPAMQYAYLCEITGDPAAGWTVTFPDVPEAITGGADRKQALALAEDCLDTALGARMAANEPIPIPSPARGRPRIAPTPTVALKAALYDAMRRDSLTQARLASMMGKSDRIVRRLLDPGHPSKLTELQAALTTLGLAVRIEVGRFEVR